HGCLRWLEPGTKHARQRCWRRGAWYPGSPLQPAAAIPTRPFTRVKWCCALDLDPEQGPC
ncbi:MAG: hypothetical protein ACR2QK_20855, partial [Acidimicrobiales bacterium]